MRVSRWGNSLAVRLPKKLAEELGLAPGDELNVVAVAKGRISVDKTDKRADFVRQIEAFRFSLPAGHEFDRDEANER